MTNQSLIMSVVELAAFSSRFARIHPHLIYSYDGMSSSRSNREIAGPDDLEFFYVFHHCSSVNTIYVVTFPHAVPMQ